MYDYATIPQVGMLAGPQQLPFPGPGGAGLSVYVYVCICIDKQINIYIYIHTLNHYCSHREGDRYTDVMTYIHMSAAVYIYIYTYIHIHTICVHGFLFRIVINAHTRTNVYLQLSFKVIALLRQFLELVGILQSNSGSLRSRAKLALSRSLEDGRT